MTNINDKQQWQITMTNNNEKQQWQTTMTNNNCIWVGWGIEHLYGANNMTTTMTNMVAAMTNMVTTMTNMVTTMINMETTTTTLTNTIELWQQVAKWSQQHYLWSMITETKNNNNNIMIMIIGNITILQFGDSQMRTTDTGLCLLSGRVWPTGYCHLYADVIIFMLIR